MRISATILLLGVRSQTSQFSTTILFPTRTNDHEVDTVAESGNVVFLQLRSDVIVKQKH